MPERRHRTALEHAHSAVARGPLRETLPAEFRPPAEPPRHRRKALLEQPARAGLGPEVVDQDDLTARLGDPRELVERRLRVGHGGMTYCATTASKKASGKPRCCASITASASTWASLCSATGSGALRSIGSE